MVNPWLAVPLGEYEGHMRAENVGQLDALAELFGRALAFCRPRSVAVLGVAGGNGLDRIDSCVTRRVVGIDVNGAYLDRVRERYAGLPGLELHVLDLAAGKAGLEPVELVHAALIFEHAGVDACLKNALSLVAPGGRLSVVLQLPGEPGCDVSPTPYASVQALRSSFSLIDPGWLRGELVARGLRLVHETHQPLPGRKAFWLGIFAAELLEA